MKNNYKKIYSILNKKQKLYILVIFFLTIINVFFEVFSLSLVIPVMQSIFGENLDDRFSFIIIIKDYINLKSEDTLVIILFFLLFVFLIKTIFIQFFFWFKGKFSYNLVSSISKKIYKTYLHQKISFFLIEIHQIS